MKIILNGEEIKLDGQNKVNRKVEFVKKEEIYDCNNRKAEIIDELREANECSVDNDCRYYDYGYPFQQNACRKAIVSTMDEKQNVANFAQIQQYKNECVTGNEVEMEKYNQLQEDAKSEQCNLVRLYCYKGYCRTKNYSSISNDSPLR